MPITLNGSTGVTYPDGVTQASGVPTASATSGAPLVSNGTIYTQNTPVGVAFGGTGATDAATARSNLGTNDAANITTGTLGSARLPSSGVNAASITTGTLAVANGGTGLTSTPSNGQLDIGNGSGFTRATLTAGSGISITNGAGSISIAATGGGTVTSVATGNGLSGGTITTSGTLTIACPTFNTVGSYCTAGVFRTGGGGVTYNGGGTNYSAGSGDSQVRSIGYVVNFVDQSFARMQEQNNLSGTWKAMWANQYCNGNEVASGVMCRVS